MASIAESLLNQSQLGAVLHAGLDTLSQDQEVTFVQYTRVTLPLDGYVFWVRADILSPAAIFNATTFNAVPFNVPPNIETPAPTITAKGSLHYATEGHQVEDETIAIHRVIFTSEREVRALAEIAPAFMYVATLPDGNRYTFSGRKQFYRQAKLWHYVGDAVYPALESQLVEFPAALDTKNVVVSNSLPIWLAMNENTPPIFSPASQRIPLYPSYVVPDNITPPYGVVDIPTDSTRALQAAPALDRTLSHSQLCAERVKITLYGLRNFNAIDFQDFVIDYSLRTDDIGIMNMPIIRDAKRTQVELSAIAMKKEITFDINYYQSRARNIARQMILSAVPSFDIDHSPLFRERRGDR